MTALRSAIAAYVFPGAAHHHYAVLRGHRDRRAPQLAPLPVRAYGAPEQAARAVRPPAALRGARRAHHQHDARHAAGHAASHTADARRRRRRRAAPVSRQRQRGRRRRVAQRRDEAAAGERRLQRLSGRAAATARVDEQAAVGKHRIRNAGQLADVGGRVARSERPHQLEQRGLAAGDQSGRAAGAHLRALVGAAVHVHLREAVRRRHGADGARGRRRRGRGGVRRALPASGRRRPVSRTERDGEGDVGGLSVRRRDVRADPRRAVRCAVVRVHQLPAQSARLLLLLVALPRVLRALLPVLSVSPAAAVRHAPAAHRLPQDKRRRALVRRGAQRRPRASAV